MDNQPSRQALWIRRLVREAASTLHGQYLILDNGTPAIVFKDVDFSCSICYFGSTNTWKVFYPYNPEHSNQKSIIVDSVKDIQAFLDGDPFEQVRVIRCRDLECQRYIREDDEFCYKHKEGLDG